MSLIKSIRFYYIIFLILFWGIFAIEIAPSIAETKTLPKVMVWYFSNHTYDRYDSFVSSIPLDLSEALISTPKVANIIPLKTATKQAKVLNIPSHSDISKHKVVRLGIALETHYIVLGDLTPLKDDKFRLNVYILNVSKQDFIKYEKIDGTQEQFDSMLNQLSSKLRKLFVKLPTYDTFAIESENENNLKEDYAEGPIGYLTLIVKDMPRHGNFFFPTREYIAVKIDNTYYAITKELPLGRRWNTCIWTYPYQIGEPPMTMWSFGEIPEGIISGTNNIVNRKLVECGRKEISLVLLREQEDFVATTLCTWSDVTIEENKTTTLNYDASSWKYKKKKHLKIDDIVYPNE